MITKLRQSSWRRWFRRARRAADARRYRDALPALETRDAGALRALARQPDTEPEVLYYLAGDAEPAVRRAVAANPATPAQADRLLCDDSDDSVRGALARKIGRLVPDLDPASQARLRQQAVELLERLAQDHLAQVRQIVAEEVKHSPNVPRGLVRRLAEDVETIVCAPVLEYSPLLQDEDLIEIIAATTAEGALSAIARRQGLGGAVSDAIVATIDVPAVASLLANPSAEIRAGTLDQIVAQAAAIQDWQAPLVVRPELSLRTMRRIAGFVGSALVEEMARHHDLDAETALGLARQVRSRLRHAHFDQPEPPGALADAATDALHNDDALAEAIEAGRGAVVTEILALRTNLPPATVGAILAARNGRAATALVWKAGLGMRVAVKLQQHLLRLPPAKVLNAREGLHFPLTEAEMVLQLELFGVAA